MMIAAAYISPKFTEDGLYAVWDPAHPVTGKAGLNGGTIIVVREGEIFGIKCVPLEHAEAWRRALANVPTMLVRKLRAEDFE